MNQRSQPSIAIIGTGALACIFATRLSAVANIHVIGSWQDQINAINSNGITLHELDGSSQTVSVMASCHPQQAGLVSADYVIVLVKSFQTEAAIQRIKCCVKPETVVLTLQNGLGNIEKLQEGLPDHFISAGITMQGGNIKSIGNVIHAGNGQTVVDDAPQLVGLPELFNAAGVPTDTARQSGARSISEVLWRKLTINSAVNPLTALLGQTNGYLADNDAARALSEATAVETAQVARLEGAWPDPAASPADSRYASAAAVTKNAAAVTKNGAAVTENAVAVTANGAAVTANAAAITTSAASVTGPNRSSMLQDISRGSRTEIDSICGEVVRRAKLHGHPAPYNEAWWTLVRQAEKNTSGSGGRPLHLIEALVQLTANSNR